MKYFTINLKKDRQELNTQNCKMVLRETKDPNKWAARPF